MPTAYSYFLLVSLALSSFTRAPRNLEFMTLRQWDSAMARAPGNNCA